MKDNLNKANIMDMEYFILFWDFNIKDILDLVFR